MPAEVVLRLILLKHIRNLSDGTLEREVRANLVYRNFTRLGGGKVPEAKTFGKWGWQSDRRCCRRFTCASYTAATIWPSAST
jgi:IS5 family transposase